MIKTLIADIKKENFLTMKETIDAYGPLNKFDHEIVWASQCINAQSVYKINRFVQRVVEETGPVIQEQVIKLFNLKKIIFPYKAQLIKIDKNIFNTDIIIENQICQTITLFKEDSVTYVLPNSVDIANIPESTIGEYAIATYWTEFKDPSYPKWFVEKYLERYDQIVKDAI